MTFLDMPNGESVFVDANVLVYFFGPDPVWGPACQNLMQQIEQGALGGFTSAHVLNEMVYRLLGLEAMSVYGWPFQGLSARLRRHPAEVQGLSRARMALQETDLIGIKVLDVSRSLVSLAADVTAQYGLLPNDALIVTAMRAAGLTHLASNDADFDRVAGLIRYSPV